MKISEQVLRKIRNDIRGAAVSYVYYDGVKVYSRRDTHITRPDHTRIGVFRRNDTDADILDRLATKIEAYNERKTQQSDRFTQALGL